MRKNIKNKILLSILAAGVFYLPAYADAASLTITADEQGTPVFIPGEGSGVENNWVHTGDDGYQHIYYDGENAASNNTITIFNGDKNDSLTLGSGKRLYIYGANANITGSTQDNPVTLSSNTITFGDDSSANTFNANASTLDIYGANANISNGGTAFLTGNQIYFNANRGKNIFKLTEYSTSRLHGAYAKITGGSATLSNNCIALAGTNTLEASASSSISLNGAYALIPSSKTGTATLTGNYIAITGSNTFTTSSIAINGAYAYFIGSGTATLTGNYLNISGSNTFTTKANINLCGANAYYNIYGSGSATLKDNSININAGTGGNTFTTGGNIDFLGAYLYSKGYKENTQVTGTSIKITGSNGSNTFKATGNGSAINLYGARANISASNKTDASTASISQNYLDIAASSFTGSTNLYGAYADIQKNAIADVKGNYVEINDGVTFKSPTNIYGAYVNLLGTAALDGNSVTISGGEFNDTTNIYAAYLNYITGTITSIKDNSITLTGNAGNVGNSLKNVNLYGSSHAINNSTVDNNYLVVDGWSGTVGSVNNFENINFENISLEGNSEFNVQNSVNNMDEVVINIISVGAGDYKESKEDDEPIKVTLTLGEKIPVKTDKSNIVIADSLNDTTKYYTADYADDGIYANKFSELSAEVDTTNNHKINISAKVDKTILAGKFIDTNNISYYNSSQTEDTASLTIGENFSSNASVIAGAYALGNNAASGGKVYIEDNNYNGTVYAGFSENGTVGKNTAYIGNGAQAANLTLAGDNQTAGTPSSAALAVTGNGNTLGSISRFDTITFDDVKLNDAAALTVQSANLDNTAIFVNSLAGGNTFKTNDKVTLLTALTADAITGNVKSLGINNEIILAGVAQNLTVSAAQEDNSINLTVTGVGLTEQTNLLTESRAASAAFLNQSTDLINDSLDVLGRDGTYGVKTFAAVQGNRSTYDVADDLKINGWSVIAGFGAENEHKGGDFAWGVFYENGSGNYRTYNTFNNEFFRGDGSMVYNGGGIAARYENAKGVYTEGSLRAGMLKNEMDNALHDGAGNSYGYETESTYYGAHIGVGQIFELGENTDLDVYGKFFHTYVDGDTVTIGGDTFDFDHITSDRLRVGARVTKQQAKVNTYYGLAYEYEFNGDVDMTAQGIRAEKQSFGGGTGIAELGFNYQPGTDSPWNFDLNLRGYVGERQGGSFNVQATYTF